MFVPIAFLSEWGESEVAVFCRQVNGFSLFDDGFLFEAVCYEVSDGNYLESEFFCHLLQLRQACHSSIGIHDFYQCGGGLQSGKSCQVNSSLGVSGASQHSFVLGVEGIDMAGASECFRHRCGVCKGAYGSSAVSRAYACGTSLEFVDGDGKRCAEH